MDPRVPEPPDSPRLFRPRRVGEILAHAFEIYRQHWQNLFALVAVIVVPLVAIQTILTQSVVNNVTDTGVVLDSGSRASSALAGLGVAVLSILMWTVLTGAITRAAAGTFLGRDMDIAESYRFGLARFWSIVLIGVLAALAIGVGFLLLIIPGFIVLTRLSCSLPSLVLEDKRGTKALSRSWDLVAGFGWHVFGTIIVSAFLTGIVSSILTTPFRDNAFLYFITQSIASIITMPYMALVGILIYFDLRVRKERYSPEDLERELARTATP